MCCLGDAPFSEFSRRNGDRASVFGDGVGCLVGDTRDVSREIVGGDVAVIYRTNICGSGQRRSVGVYTHDEVRAQSLGDRAGRSIHRRRNMNVTVGG